VNTNEMIRSAYRRVEEAYDIVVCGGGLAGLCAAVAAARHGAKVCLVQDRPVFGGNSSSEIRVPPQGAASSHAYAKETGIISELLIEERARNHEDPTGDNGWINSVWDLVQYEMVMATANLSFRLNTTVKGVLMKDELTIEAVVAQVNHAETELVLRANTFIDCTGDGIVAAFASCEWRMGTEGRDEYNEPHAPLQASSAVMGNSIHFKAKDMGRPVPFTAPDWAVKYEDPDFFYKHGRWPGDTKSGFWWIELSVPWHTIYDNEKLRHELTRHVMGIWDWIKNGDSEFRGISANYALDWIGQVPGKRESRRIVGEYWMTEHDPLQKTVFHDEIAYGGWFIDLHEPGGLLAPVSERTTSEGHDSSYGATTYVGPYGIPLRILIAKGMNNVMMAGRNVSVTHAALGTVRVQGTTALMGQAAGTAAAIAIQTGMPVRQVPELAAREVQQALLRDGCFLLNTHNEDPDDLARLASVYASSEAKLSGAEPSLQAESRINEALASRRGQWIAVGADRIDMLSLCLSNLSDTVQTVEARLYAVEHIWDYRTEPGEALAIATLAVDPGNKQWIDWKTDLDVSRLKGQYIRLDLLANPLVYWHAADKVVPGHVSAYDLLNGFMRRFGNGLTMSFRIFPEQACYSANQVLSGVTRPYRSTNQWRSDPAKSLPQWVELSWSEPVQARSIELTFPGYILRDYRSYPAFYRDPDCPRDVRAEAFIQGQWLEIGSLAGNYQRKATIRLEQPVQTDRVRITVLATNGDASASLYEIRVYNT